jgi:hypothetical protein
MKYVDRWWLLANSIDAFCSMLWQPGPGMPDGFVFKPKIPIWVNIGGLAMENVGMFYVHSVYFKAIGNILWPFCKFCGHLEYFSPFW